MRVIATSSEHQSGVNPFSGRRALLVRGLGLMVDLPTSRESRAVVDETELHKRRAAWRAPVEAPRRGYQQLYMEHVLQAEHGCDFDFLRKA